MRNKKGGIMSKRILGSLAILFLVFNGTVCSQTLDMRSKMIFVTGKASISVKPDVAYFPIDVSTTGISIRETYEKNNLKIKDVLGKLKKLGVSDKQVAIKEPALFIEQSYAGGNDIALYGVSNVIIVTLKGIDKLKSGALMNKVFDIIQSTNQTTTFWSSPGISDITSETSRIRNSGGRGVPVIYGISNYEELLDDVIEKAVRDADIKAERTAKKRGGVAITGLDNYNYFEPYDYKGKLLPDGPKTLNSQELEIDVSVNAYYSFKLLDRVIKVKEEK